MPYINPHEDIREAQATAARPVGRAGVVIDGRLHPYASIGQRIAATTIDLFLYRFGLIFVLVLCAYIVTLQSVAGTGDDGLSIPAFTVCVVYAIACFGPLTYRGGGQSPGKKLVGIRVVADDGCAAPLQAVLLRETPWRTIPLVLVPIGATPTIFDLGLAAIGVVFALLATADPQRQTFYDRLAHTVVVEADPVRLQ